MKLLTPTIVLLLALCCGCSGRQSSGNRIPAVQIDTVETCGRQRMLEFPGRVKAAQEVNLAFKVSGTLQQVFVREGDFVREGALIAQLDPRDYRLQAEAAEAEYNHVKAEAERVIALYADKVTTPNAYDKARFGLQQITAKFENAKNQLADTKIYAPFDGYVQRQWFDTPAVVGAGTPVATVVSAGAPEIEINIPGSEYVRRGDFAAFEASFDFWPGRKLPLKLLSINPKANANQLYTVRLGIPAGFEPRPTPGMNTMVSVAFRSSENSHITIPSVALFAAAGGSCVWIFRPDSTVEQRAVIVESLRTDGGAAVSAGLTAGERIVTAGAHRLHNGQQVAPLPGAAATNVGGML